MTLKLGDVIPADCDDVGPLLLRNFKDDGTGHLAKNDVPGLPSIQANRLLRLGDPFAEDPDLIGSNIDYETEASGNGLVVCADTRPFGEANKLLRLRLEAPPVPPPFTITLQLAGLSQVVNLASSRVCQFSSPGAIQSFMSDTAWSYDLAIPQARSLAAFTAHYEYDPDGARFRISGGGLDSGWVGLPGGLTSPVQISRGFTEADSICEAFGDDNDFQSALAFQL